MSDRNGPHAADGERRETDPRSMLHPDHPLRDLVKHATAADWVAAERALSDAEVRARYGLDDDLAADGSRERLWRENHAILDRLYGGPFEKSYVDRICRIWDMPSDVLTDAFLYTVLEDDEDKQALIELLEEEDR